MSTIITQDTLDQLTEQAKASPRKRVHLDLRNSVEDTSQRMITAIEPSSTALVPLHFHRHSSETVVCLRGRLVEEFYDAAGQLTETFELAPGGPIAVLNVPAGQWHTARALESGTVILEMKDGQYVPNETEG